ncbi:Lactobacillus shifted protein [Ceratobasidium theobromae]|uniref:Lactobacillus shifted protein n=1 Tax=Ceratobasidium theobromae TaxID=1582974 RepID=A0A5N5QPU4_9AGAM|nr:Lactobacillus shifted protein [Ceratobasidium theobromae]
MLARLVRTRLVAGTRLYSTEIAKKPTNIHPQAPNREEPWSASQRPRPGPEFNARFEQTAMSLQPAPLSAQDLINYTPIRAVHGRRAVCDGGGGPLGHPKVFINLASDLQ